jgi:formiminotetrahydrofolate cyclodeaminase
VERALEGATLVPLAVARATAEVAALAVRVAEIGNVNAAADATMAALVAAAACRGSANNVRVNAAGLADRALGKRLAGEAGELAAAAARAVATADGAARRAPPRG